MAGEAVCRWREAEGARPQHRRPHALERLLRRRAHGASRMVARECCLHACSPATIRSGVTADARRVPLRRLHRWEYPSSRRRQRKCTRRVRVGRKRRGAPWVREGRRHICWVHLGSKCDALTNAEARPFPPSRRRRWASLLRASLSAEQKIPRRAQSRASRSSLSSAPRGVWTARLHAHGRRCWRLRRSTGGSRFSICRFARRVVC